jgi:hypothetical protein
VISKKADLLKTIEVTLLREVDRTRGEHVS